MNATLRSTPSSQTSKLKRLAQPFVAPAVFDFWASRVNRTWTWNRPLARIVAKLVESSDAVTLVLKPNRHWAGYKSGQHLNISAEIDGSLVTRSYSFTHLPNDAGDISITVKAIAGGKLSQHLCHSAQIGDVLEIGAAFGAMTLPEPVQGACLFLAAGSGITPLIAMTRELAAQQMPVPLSLIYWARTRDELCFADELRALAAAHADFNVHFMLTRETPTLADENAGRISESALTTLVDALDVQQVFACGPGGFVDSARAVCSTRSLSFQAEAFTPPPIIFENTGSVTVTLALSGRSLVLPRGQSLLIALEAEGLKPASGCRMGICNTCVCGKTSGTSRNLQTGHLVDEPVSALKLCIHSANSDLVLNL